MAFELGRTRKLTALRRGDVININVPFEENTRDYYNGYKPSEIREKPFTDRFGRSSKTRMVIYLGRDGQDMLYLPLTSKTNSGADALHQYELKDVSMLPLGDPPKRSFVELDSVRCMHISYQRELAYTGYLNKEDLNNILHRVSNATLQYDSKRDCRGYIPSYMEKTFTDELKNRGYKKTLENEDRKQYAKIPPGTTITRTKYGMVHYHYPLSKEEVKQMVNIREGQIERLTKAHQNVTNEFIENVNNLSQEGLYVTC